MKNFNPYPYRTQNVSDYVEDDDEGSEDNEESPDRNFTPNGDFYKHEDSKRHPKKRKLESFVSRRESWSDEDTSVLLQAWRDRFMELGRRSLRPEDWSEVTEKVAEMSGIERSEAGCRNQLDVLKNKYKKERAKVESGNSSKWVFFKKMDVLLNPRLRGDFGFLGCGVDSGEYVFTNPRIYLDKSNVLDEMRDSPGQSDVDCESDEESEDNENIEEDDLESARLLNESIQKFGEMYEKIEESKSRQMVELESLRRSFQRELELQKKQIFERAQAEIAKIREMFDDDENESDDNGDDDDDDDDDDDNDDGDETDTSVETLKK